VFGFGVASGDPTDGAVVIWTRVEAAGPVAWRVARDEGLTEVVASGVVEATDERDRCVSVDVGGLDAGATYWYGFGAGGVDSPVGRTRTLPAAGAEHVRFAFTSCAKFNAGFFNVYDRLADRDDLDVVLHLGDYVYEASNTPPASQTPGADIGRPFEPRHECVTLEDYRRRYAQYHLDPSLQRLRAAHPIITCIDDHELADGAWRAGAAEHRDEYGAWDDRKAAALRAREEWVPLRRPDTDDPTRVHRVVHVGDLADLVLLDTRSRRDQPTDGAHLHDDGRTALGDDQRAWLFETLTSSSAAWRLVGNPSILSSTWHPQLPPDLGEAMLKLKLIDPDGTGRRDFDQWDGYPAERADLLDLFDALDDVVVLSGDIHVGAALELHRDPWGADTHPVAIELVSPSVTSQNLDDKLGYPRGGSKDVQARFVETHPHVQWADFDGHGYVVVDLDRDELRATWWVVDDVLAPCDAEERVAAFAVRRGHVALVPQTTG
jgi:phosphodiesterase/alkaline phosphatase D-like protein